VHVQLGVPDNEVQVRVTGGASQLSFARPAGVPVRVDVRGGASKLVIDDQSLGSVSGIVSLSSRDDVTRPGYVFVITGGASQLSVRAK
jgi:hypothetical protein